MSKMNSCPCLSSVFFFESSASNPILTFSNEVRRGIGHHRAKTQIFDRFLMDGSFKLWQRACVSRDASNGMTHRASIFQWEYLSRVAYLFSLYRGVPPQSVFGLMSVIARSLAYL
jgi:hypothetical protein